MTLEERVMSKIQEVMGEYYELNLGVAFDRRYTLPLSTPNGLIYDINYQAFDENKDKVVGVFTMQPTDYNVVPYLSYNTNYTLQLWYSLDNFKVDKFGVPIGDLPIDIYSNLATLRTTLNNTTIDFGGGIRGKMTFSEPLKSTNYDNTGIGKRGVLTINGKINLTDKGLFGSDRIIKLGVTTGETISYYAFTKRSYTIGNSREGTSTQKTGAMRPSINGQSNGNTVVFTYDNYTDATNLAMAMVEKVAYGDSGVDSNFIVPVRIYSGTTLLTEYNALLSADIIGQNGETGTEIIQVTLQRS